MIFFILYLLFVGLSGYIWFNIYKYWSEQNVSNPTDKYGYRSRYEVKQTPKKDYNYEVKPLYILGFIFLSLLSIIGAVIGICLANEQEIDILNIKIKSD